MNSEKGLMIEGNIWKQLILFSIPLLLGNLFQQLYNTVDSIVVGKFISSQALAAVGSSHPIINLLVSFFMGIGVGAGVVISRYFGARDQENLSKGMHTAIALALLSGIFLSVIGVLLCPLILEWVQTPADVMNDSLTYLRIFFSGTFFMVIYNLGSGVLRALGDSKNPLYFLILSSIINIILDIVFVVNIHMGIEGVAYATVISQAISSICVIVLLATTKREYKINLRKLRLDKALTKEIVTIGLPSGIQNAVVAFSNVIVQSNINSFGSTAMAGCSACQKIDGFAIMPVMSYSMALTTYTGQNIGAKRYDRVKEGTKIGLILSLGTTITISILLLIFGRNMIQIFDDDPQVIGYGMQMLTTLVPCYFLLATTHALNGVVRGAGKTKVGMFVMIGCWCLMRMAWILTMKPIFNDIRIVFLGWPITWVVSSILLVRYYRSYKWIPQDA